jgi:O-methyltransferase
MTDVVDVLVADALAAMTNRGRTRIALLGFGDVCCRVYGQLNLLGLHERVVGVYEPRVERQGSLIGGHIVEGVASAAEAEIDLLIVCDDREKESLLGAYAHEVDNLPEAVIAGVAHFDFRNPIFAAATEKALVKSTATGSPFTLIHLFECLRSAKRIGASGVIAEFGMYKGGTTVMLARMARLLGLDCPLIGFDSFAGFPAKRSLLDLYADPVCEFEDLDAVRQYCEPYGIEIVVGDIAESWHRLESETLLLSFFDTDNYSPTRAALPVCIENTVVGGSIVFDHFFSLPEFRYTLGERMAAVELFDASSYFHLHGTGVFTRIH